MLWKVFLKIIAFFPGLSQAGAGEPGAGLAAWLPGPARPGPYQASRLPIHTSLGSQTIQTTTGPLEPDPSNINLLHSA